MGFLCTYNVLYSFDPFQFEKQSLQFGSTIIFFSYENPWYMILSLTFDRWKDLHPGSLINTPEITQASFPGFFMTDFCIPFFPHLPGLIFGNYI